MAISGEDGSVAIFEEPLGRALLWLAIDACERAEIDLDEVTGIDHAIEQIPVVTEVGEALDVGEEDAEAAAPDAIEQSKEVDGRPMVRALHQEPGAGAVGNSVQRE